MIEETKINNLLERASVKGHTETVKALLEAGADVRAREDYALRLARVSGHAETVKLLEDALNSEPAKAVSAMREEFRKQTGVELSRSQAQAALGIAKTLLQPMPSPT